MGVKYLFLNALFSFLISSPAIASDWVFVQSNKSMTSYVDRQSIKGDATNKKFWEKTVFKKEQNDSFGRYSIRRDYVEIDCNNNTLKLHEMNFYSSEGEVVNLSISHPESFRIIPDSVGEVVKEYVCSFQPTK